MSHLSRDQLLDAIEAGATPATRSHLASCDRCRREVDALRRTLSDVRAVDVPEPSPLFWDHLTARVREAIALEPEPGAVRSERSWYRPVFAAVAIAVAAVAVDRGVRSRYAVDDQPKVAAASVPEAPSPDAPESAAPDSWSLDAGDDWQFIVDVATASARGMHGGGSSDEVDLGAAAGASDLAVSELSADERRALVKLLNDAMAGADRAITDRATEGDV